jgi:hypothetical protein
MSPASTSGPDAAVAGEAGVRPYVYVENVDETLQRVSGHGGVWQRGSPG